MATPYSPSKMVSSTNLSLSNSSPWRLKVTVEAQPDNDMFLDLAAEESLTKQIRKPKASKSRLASKPVAPPRKTREDTAASEDSLGLDNTSGIFASDLSPIRVPITPKRPLSELSRTQNTIIIPLKGSEPKQKPQKRKGTPARKKAREINLSASEPDIAPVSTTTTPKRGRGRPRKSINATVDVASDVVGRGGEGGTDVQRDEISQNGIDIEKTRPQTPVEDTFHMPSPPSSPIAQIPGRDTTVSGLPPDDQENSIIASEGFSMIAPQHSTSLQAPVGLTTPRPTPDIEDHNAEDAMSFSKPLSDTRSHRDGDPIATSSKQALPAAPAEEELIEEDLAEEEEYLPSKTRPRRRRSMRLASKPTENDPAEPSAKGSNVTERFRELTRNVAKANQPPLPDPRDEASSFRRLLQTEPDKIVPGTYEESTVYFAHKKSTQGIDRRRQTPAKKSRAGIVEPAEGEGFGNILPEHLLPPVKPMSKRKMGIEKSTTNIRAAGAPRKGFSATRQEEQDAFDEEGRSVRWHEEVMGGSFSLNSSSMERPEPEAPQQESTHRLLENEIIVEPFRPNAGRLKDGTPMPLVVPKEWTNHHWAVLTDISYPQTKLVTRSQRSMGKLHPEESAEQAMERRRRILRAFPRNDEGHLILSERDSDNIDAFEEYMRREILGEKRIAGESRRMWGFSRHQIKEALIVLQVSRQRRIQWVVSAGENLEDWGLA